MKIHAAPNQFVATREPIALTIGNFDGLHLGHQALLNRLKLSASHTVVFTFANHPQEVLQEKKLLRLTTLDHRLALLEQAGIDQLILTTFTKPFSQQTAKEFLTALKTDIPFNHLILGHDAMVGSDRETDLRSLCAELDFSLEYLPPFAIDGQIISSTTIRKAIQQGDLNQAAALLGRPYSIRGRIEHGEGKGKKIGFPTANIPVENLVLPPLGVYGVKALIAGQVFPAIANLGRAPTLHTDRPPVLEVHLINESRDLYGLQAEVIFDQFIRPEKKFNSLLELQNQIKSDIAQISP